MHGTTKENIHYWKNTQGKLMVSNETNKTLKSFNSIDEAVNFLFFNGFKESARQLNKEGENNE